MVLGLLLLTSCTKDNYDGCPSQETVNLLIKTDYDLRSASAAAAEWYAINEVFILIIDQHNNVVTSWEGGAYASGADYRASFQLEEGTYRFVVWTNLGENYTISASNGELKNGIFMDEVMINMTIPPDGMIRDFIPHRHYGSITNAQVIRNKDNTFVITLIPHTYKVNFTVKGLAPTFHQYDFMVTDNNSSHRLDNSCVLGKECYHHIRTTDYQPRSRSINFDPFTNELSDSMILLQLDDDTPTTFTISNTITEEVIYTADLLQTIEQAYQDADEVLDFSSIYEFDILFTFDTYMYVTVSVNGWSYIEQNQKL